MVQLCLGGLPVDCLRIILNSKKGLALAWLEPVRKREDSRITPHLERPVFVLPLQGKVVYNGGAKARSLPLVLLGNSGVGFEEETIGGAVPDVGDFEQRFRQGVVGGLGEALFADAGTCWKPRF